MSLGYDREQNIVYLGDTAIVRAYLYDKDDQAVSEDELISVNFTIEKPDDTLDTSVGEIEGDGIGLLRYNDTDLVGQYQTIASFTYGDNGDIRSARADFEVVDPLKPVAVSPSWVAANDAWSKFEDCFDAEDEGPWLRDMTLNYFNKNKMEKFIDDALMDINLQHPPTDYDLGYFVTEIPGVGEAPSTFQVTDLPLLTQGLVVQIIRHLIRSYVEQPNPVGAQIAWHDRRDYLQRWQSVLQVEQQHYMRLLALWKRQFLGLGQTRLLVSSKAGRLIPAPMRTRNVGRGYWAVAPIPLLPIPEPIFLATTGVIILGYGAAHLLKVQSRKEPRNQLLPTQVGEGWISRTLQRLRPHVQIADTRECFEPGVPHTRTQSEISLELLQRERLRRLW